MGYQEILNRLVEIIKLSEEKRLELEAFEIFDKDKLPQEKNFIGYYPYNIYKEYYKEFEDLKNKELTYFLLNTDKYAGLKNQILIKECRELIEINSDNKDDYQRIISIVENSYGKSANHLIYILGYFICQEDLAEFQNLCFKHKIGSGKQLSSNKEEVLEFLDVSKRQNVEQRKRILKHMSMLNAKNEVTEELTHVDVKVEEKKHELENLKANDSIEDLNVSLDGKYKEIIYLGMLGYLNSRMIAELKTIMRAEEFKGLLNALAKNGIFTQEEILDIELDANKKIKHISDIDELVAFFAVRKDLNVSALKALIPSIGIDNYHYLMDQLFKFNTITFDTYKKYLEEFGYLKKNSIQSR